METTIVWFRQDLRIEDNRVLAAALRRGSAVIPLFIWSPEEEEPWPLGKASRWWLHHSLIALQQEFINRGSRLIIRTGPALEVLQELIRQTGADTVYYGRRYESHILERDRQITLELQKAGITMEAFNNSLLIEPWKIENKAGKPFKVFTPYWNQCLKLLDTELLEPLAAPAVLPSVAASIDSVSLPDLNLNPEIEHALLEPASLESNSLKSDALNPIPCLHLNWSPGAATARAKLETFLQGSIHEYDKGRDNLQIDGTSLLSPYLHFGEISPRQIWSAVVKNLAEFSAHLSASCSASCHAYLRQLGWREFAYYLIYHFPETASMPMQEKFVSFPWRSDPHALQCWKKGKTGYPIVDAAMRQLSSTGWMNNRLRMVVASFLAKDLLVPWQDGARWFWETLVDADLANNTMGWQWVAGCGADAAPFFRIFNPVSQGEKFDPGGLYVRQWLPELARLSGEFIHKPWLAPQSELEAAGIILGTTYPYPIVDHNVARLRALDKFHAMASK